MTRRRGKGPYLYPCPTCGEIVQANAAYAARQRRPCRPCIRVENGWTCRTCGSSDPRHPAPCPDATPEDRSDIVGFRDGSPIRRHPDSTSGGPS